MDACGQGRADKFGDVFNRGGGYARDAAEVHQETLLGLLSDSSDVVEGGVDLRLAAEVAVEGDAETVCFVPYVGDHAEGL